MVAVMTFHGNKEIKTERWKGILNEKFMLYHLADYADVGAIFFQLYPARMDVATCVARVLYVLTCVNA